MGKQVLDMSGRPWDGKNNTPAWDPERWPCYECYAEIYGSCYEGTNTHSHEKK